MSLCSAPEDVAGVILVGSILRKPVVHLVSPSAEHTQKRKATKRIGSDKGKQLINEMEKLSRIPPTTVSYTQ